MEGWLAGWRDERMVGGQIHKWLAGWLGWEVGGYVGCCLLGISFVS